MNKVFCDECKYYRPFEIYIRQEQCRKIVDKIEYTPVKKKNIYGKPSQINRNNDCEMYVFGIKNYFKKRILDSL